MTYKLLNVGKNAKTIKGDGEEYLTAILYMHSWKIMVDGNLFNSCSMATLAGCVDGCLISAGRGQMNSVQEARRRKAEWFYRDRDNFMKQMVTDCGKFVKYCLKHDIQPCVRPNGTTDIRWELIPCERDGITYPNLMIAFPEIQWYDYTKIPNRKLDHLDNYHLTWSYSAANPKYEQYFDGAIQNMPVAVVFRTPYPHETWKGYKVVDGDKDDLRFLDPKQSIVALYAKGRAKKDQSGFVVDIVA